ncbi:response regulator [Mucilaginibacter xinganensis]|uniref:response regulator n=1 Tax=Mucilaginibacter xinganensis TaxID=1234841 RepID=UPI0012FD5D1C|nr:response regulator [Mucilaginibacter xinganensis]
MKRNPSENIKLLIVDDKIDNVEILEAALEQEGLDIITTSTPKQVIDLCIRNNIGIALIDVKMPGLDGFELLDLIKQNPLTKDIIVVLITGYSTKSGDVVKGLNNGAADYLFKPLDLYHFSKSKIADYFNQA